ncbi:unnamed protein product [Moneuplotes crassus]|uniref:Uncharacterized protein n=1 Tax=Euplotes crassus TaxID=5936 RepID=A0AAD1XSX3_EUPCR|nr:unnamed protein product [Moneuplotes crassus]
MSQFEEEQKVVEQAEGYEFYYKLVAKLQGKYYSIYDPTVEYELNTELYEKAQPGHGGGYYVYATPKEAIFADIPFKEGGLYMAPRTVLKVKAWGDFVIYDNGKMSFSYIVPVADLGIPRGYKSTRAAWRASIQAEDEASGRVQRRPRPATRLNPEDNPDFYFQRRERNARRPRRQRRPVVSEPSVVTDEEQASAYRNMDLGLEPDDILGGDVGIDHDDIMNDVQSRFQEMLRRLEMEP